MIESYYAIGRHAVVSSRGVARGSRGVFFLVPCGEDNETTSTDRGGEGQKSERNGVSLEII